jgi:hypothetical protein
MQDEYFNANSYRLSHGQIEQVNEFEWRTVLDVVSYEDLPVGVWVDLRELNSVMRNCFSDAVTRHGALDASIYWLPDNCDLIKHETYQKIMGAGVKSCNNKSAPIRKNDAGKTRQKLIVAAAKIQKICRDAGYSFPLNAIRGTKKQFYKLVMQMDPTIGIAYSTFDGKDYVDQLDLAWIKGNDSDDGLPMTNAVQTYIASHPEEFRPPRK